MVERHRQEKNRGTIAAVFSLLSAALLFGCAEEGAIDLSHFDDPAQAPGHFAVCHGYGCAFASKVRLSAKEWQEVKAPLEVKAATAAEERRHIAAAIARMETLVGKKIGTDVDEGGADIFGHDSYQMDCIDEAVNTSHYLRYLEKDGVLAWHSVAEPIRRGYFTDGRWPHNTAVIREKATGKRYAVDSWFFKNGAEPAVVPAETWLAGWQPEE